MSKKALITGVTGQDGSYLAELLLEKGYSVTGTIRRISIEHQDHYLSRIKHIKKDIDLKFMSLENYSSVFSVINDCQPDELYHLAAQSNVKVSFQDEFTTLNTNINGTQNILSTIKTLKFPTKFYFAGSSEMFGNSDTKSQNESTNFNPASPYAVSKVSGFGISKNFREAYNMYCSNGILFNHESPRRSSEFVTRKITSSVARIKYKYQNKLELGNLDSKRDWGYAKEYVDVMWQLLQIPKPLDLVIGTEENHSVREFVDLAFKYVNLNYKDYVSINKDLFRPSEVNSLLSDCAKAKKELKWKPSVKFKELVELMMESDLKYLKDNSYNVT